MLPLWLSRMQDAVEFKETLEIGDLIITGVDDHPIYGIVTDLRVNRKKRVPEGQWWDIELVLLFVPPLKRTLTISGEELCGQKKVFAEGAQRFFIPIDLTSVGRRKKPSLRLVPS